MSDIIRPTKLDDPVGPFFMAQMTKGFRQRLREMDGPWSEEPDFLRWRDIATGLQCAVIRHDKLGHLCGYVRVPRGQLYDELHRRSRRTYLSMHGKLVRKRGYDIVKARHLEAHGGVNFCGKLWHYGELRGVWLGFDCAHAWDLVPGIVEMLGQDNVICSRAEYRTVDYVRTHCTALAAQIKIIIDRESAGPIDAAAVIRKVKGERHERD